MNSAAIPNSNQPGQHGYNESTPAATVHLRAPHIILPGHPLTLGSTMPLDRCTNCLRPGVLLLLAGVTLLLGFGLLPSAMADDAPKKEAAQEKENNKAAWPTYRYDNERRGIAPESLATPLDELWRYDAAHAPKPAWPAPAKQNIWGKQFNLKPRVTFDRAFHTVSDGERFYFGSSADDQVRCLSLATGKQLWTFFTEGPVRLAPVVDRGSLYFGSDDGFVYCLEAATGTLKWKTRIAPSTRLVAGNGRVISASPVRTGLLVQGETLRVACGLFPTQGTDQLVLHAQTGKELARGKLWISPQGYMQQRGEEVIVANGRGQRKSLFSFDTKIGPDNFELGPPPFDYPFAIVGAGKTRYVGGEGVVAALAPRGLAKPVVDGKKSEQQEVEDKNQAAATAPTPTTWHAEVNGRAYGLAIAGGRLLVSTDQGTIHCFGPAEAKKQPVEEKISDAKSAQSGTTTSQPSTTNVNLSRRFSVELARRVTEQCGITRGYCLVLGIGDGTVIEQLAHTSKLQIIGRDPDAKKVAAVRERLAAAGLYGRVVIHHGPLDKLPYADCLMNLIVVAPGKKSNSNEPQRVLRPTDGKLVSFVLEQGDKQELQLVIEQRDALPGAGSWSHMYANAANTICSNDAAEGEYALQWFGQPGPRDMVDRHHRTVAPLSVAGRLFIPGNERVFVVDAYNGTPLWDMKLPGSRRIGANKDCGNMVATNDNFYVVFAGTCQEIVAADGSVTRNTPLPLAGGSDERKDWGYIAVDGGQIFGSATKPGASRRELGRESIQDVYLDRRAVVTSDWLFSLDSATHKLRWRYDNNLGAILNPTITIGEEHIYFVESDASETLNEPTGRSSIPALVSRGARIVALDKQTGEKVWQQKIEFTNLEHNIYLSFAGGRLFIVGSRNQDTGKLDEKGRKIANVWYDSYAYHAATGELLWKQQQDNLRRAGGFHGEQDKRPAVVGETIYVEPYAYHVKDGKRRDEWRLTRKIWCGNISASANSLFFRNSHTARCDLKTGAIHSVCKVNRPGCWVNVIAAGGLVLMPETSSGCTCDYPVQTSMAFMPASMRLNTKGRNQDESDE